MKVMEKSRIVPFSLLSILLIIQLTPIPVRAWSLDAKSLLPVSFEAGTTLVSAPLEADLNGDGIPETLVREQGQVSILSGEEITWQSPSNWDVIQSEFTDLDQDNKPEVTLLVWRPFQPWPVDEFLPFGGRIIEHQDEEGNSCHLILIGWTGDRYGELWAGSALVNPVLSFRAVDLDGDSLQDLITLEGEYTHARSTPAHLFNVWEWNGFGFTIVYSQEGFFHDLAIVRTESNQLLVLTP
jgi:hypothetical protein